MITLAPRFAFAEREGVRLDSGTVARVIPFGEKRAILALPDTVIETIIVQIGPGPA